MEFVDGIPIDEYADSNQLGTRERLQLFIHVCEAVQHAHQKGVIHRDLKPNNILVQTLDGRPQPKVIDFGIAKATESPDVTVDSGSLTQVGQVIGTPEFMSPEQLEMNADIDTRADVYALGVLLYKLLVGAMPTRRSLGAL